MKSNYRNTRYQIQNTQTHAFSRCTPEVFQYIKLKKLMLNIFSEKQIKI